MNKLRTVSRYFINALLAAVFIGCQPVQVQEKPFRQYSVRLSNSIGSDWYECDSINRISENRLQLKNKEDSSYSVDITVPENVVVRVYPNSR